MQVVIRATTGDIRNPSIIREYTADTPVPIMDGDSFRRLVWGSARRRHGQYRSHGGEDCVDNLMLRPLLVRVRRPIRRQLVKTQAHQPWNDGRTLASLT